jgi:hypothetical protein
MMFKYQNTGFKIKKFLVANKIVFITTNGFK